MSAGLCGSLYSQTSVDQGFQFELQGNIETAVSLGAGWTILSGSFTSTTNQAGYHQVLRIWRDGSVDPSFRVAADGSVVAMAVDKGGQLLVGGAFRTIGGVTRTYLARVRANGAIDERFNPIVNGAVHSLCPLSNGDVLVGGAFDQINGQPRHHLALLHSDGTLDSTFDPSPDGPVRGLSLQEDRRIILLGDFAHVSGQSRPRLARINPNGSFDPTFDSQLETGVDSVLIQPDGKLIVGGRFPSIGGAGPASLARLLPNGRPDGTFRPSTDGPVRSLALQANGDLLIGGDFTQVGGQPRRGLARLKANGEVDTEFTSSTGGYVSWMVLQQDGKVLALSSSEVQGGIAPGRLMRLLNPEPATERFTFSDSRLRWMRGGSSPEVNRAAFDLFVPRSTWVELSVPVRIPGGWEVSGLYFPPDRNFRARSFLTTGGHFETQTETFLGSTEVYGLSEEPAPFDNTRLFAWAQGRYWAERSASLRVEAKGGLPISYQWLKDGVPLSNDPHLAGVTSPALHWEDLRLSDEGAYSVVVQSSTGSVTSSVVQVQLTGALIVTQPQSPSVRLEEAVSLSVTAVGPRLRYQWLKDGVPLEHATQPRIDLVEIQRSDAGRYSVIVSNEYQRAVSVGAIVSIVLPTADRSFTSNATLGDRRTVWGVQADGKILVSTNDSTRRPQRLPDLIRLDEHGRIDPTFKPEVEGKVVNLAFQTDGKLLVLFSAPIDGPQGQAYLYRLSRVLPNGSLDPSFNSRTLSSYTVEPLVLQQDGRILLGMGGFGDNAGSSARLVRLLPDGNPDNTFATPIIRSLSRIPFVSDIAVQPDGKILCAGRFDLQGDFTERNLLRFESDGKLDLGFQGPQVETAGTIQLQSDGNILYAGNFGGVYRFHRDGSRDPFFSFHSSSSSPLLLQADGKSLLLGGSGERVNSDGSIDGSFRLGQSVGSCIQDSEGRIVAEVFSGSFSGVQAPGLVRLKDTGPAVDKVVREGSRLTWWRGGTSPEISFAEFEMTTDSQSWTSVGTPTRIPGGWRLDAVPNRPDVAFRAIGMLPRSKGVVVSVEPIALELNLNSRFVMAGEEGCLQFKLGTPLRLKRLRFVLETPSSLLRELRANSISPDLERVSWVNQSPTRTEVECVAKAGKALPSSVEIAGFCFKIPADQPSQFLPLRIVEVEGLVEDGTVARRSLRDPKRLAILNQHPLLEVATADGGKPQLVLYAKPGWPYRVQSNPTPGNEPWRDSVDGLVTSEITTIPIQPIESRQYYRLATGAPSSGGTAGTVKP